MFIIMSHALKWLLKCFKITKCSNVFILEKVLAICYQIFIYVFITKFVKTQIYTQREIDEVRCKWARYTWQLAVTYEN